MGNRKMEATKNALGKLIAKRRLEGGEFDFVLLATDETVSGKKAAYNLLKTKLPEEYEKFKGECIQEGETEGSFEARAVKLIPSLSYEDVKSEDMDVDEDNAKRTSIEVEELFRLVSVSNVDRKTNEEEVQKFLNKFEGVETVKKYFVPRFGAKNSERNRRQFTGIYNVKFTDNASAASFLSKSDEELTLNEKVLNRQLLKTSIQNRIVRQQFAGGAHHKLRLVTCIPVEADKLSSCILVYGIGKLSETETKEVFNVEAGFTGLTMVKCVLHKYGSQFPTIEAVLSFNTSDEAKEIISNPPSQISSIMNPCLLMSLLEYTDARATIIEESKARMERIEEVYKVIKD